MKGWSGFCFQGGGGDTALGVDHALPKKKAQLTAPQNPTETDHRATEVTQTQNSAKKKNENGIFGISASRAFRKVIICHLFGGKKNTMFNAQKFSAPSAPDFRITD